MESLSLIASLGGISLQMVHESAEDEAGLTSDTPHTPQPSSDPQDATTPTDPTESPGATPEPASTPPESAPLDPAPPIPTDQGDDPLPEETESQMEKVEDVEQKVEEEEDVERVKARQILALQEQLSALEAKQAELQEASKAAAEQTFATEKLLHEHRSRLLSWNTEGKTLEEALQQATIDLSHSQTRLHVIEEETKAQDTRHSERLAEQERHLQDKSNELKRGKIENTRDSTEDLLLLRLLHSEVEKWKLAALRLESSVDIQVKEEAKNNILLGLLNAQLIDSREAGNELRLEATAGRERSLKLDEEAALSEQRLAGLVASEGQLEAAVGQSLREHEYTIARMEAREKRQESAITVLESELAEVTDKFESYSEKARLRSRASEDTEARLGAEISRYVSVQGDLAASSRESEQSRVTCEGQRQDEITKLTIGLETLAKKGEMGHKRTFEETMSLSSNAELTKQQISIEQRRIREFDETSAIEGAALKDKCDALKDTIDAIQQTAETSEKESFETVTKIAAANECMRRRIVALQNTASLADSEHIKDRISLASELATCHKKMLALEGALKRLHLERDNCVLSLQQEKQQLMSGGYKDEDVREEVARIREEKYSIVHERDVGLKRLESLEQQEKQKDRYIKDRCVAFEAEAKALQSEIKSLVREVTKLEVKVAETHEFRAKAEENTVLEDEIKHCKVEIRHMKNVISTMTVEKGLLDGYKAKVLTEQNAVQLNKLKQLEKSSASFTPLLRELVATAKKHCIADEAVTAAEHAVLELGGNNTASPAAAW